MIKLRIGYLPPDALEELLDYLERHPNKGSVIQGTGSIRKLRWYSGKNNKGKSSGVRILYHYSKEKLVLLITLYAKSKKEDITSKEKQQLKLLVPTLVEKYWRDLS